jgi:transcriptional regulator with XRE-family HTH domain
MRTLGSYLRDELHRRDLSPEEFGRRSGLGTSHIYQIIRGEKPNVRQATVDRIAKGLSMTSAELLAALNDDPDDDVIEQAIRQRTAEMREAVRDIPRGMWPTVISALFDGAIRSARDMGRLLAARDSTADSVRDAGEPGVSAPNGRPKFGRADDDKKLSNHYRQRFWLTPALSTY